MEKIEIEETSEEFKKNGWRFAKCRSCGHLIAISDNGNIKQKIYGQVKGLKSNGYDFLAIANIFSICCDKPNYKTILLDFNKDNEWIFRKIRAEFFGQFQE